MINSSKRLDLYLQISQQYNPKECDLDYTIVNKHIETLQVLSKILKSGISVFDLFKQKNIFYSINFGDLLGYEKSDIENNGAIFFDNKIHPDDRDKKFKNGISALKIFQKLTVDEKLNYKFLSEYRILNSNNKYVRLIEQHQILELDKFDNIWLSIRFIDISPFQNENEGVRCHLINYRTGKIIPIVQDEVNNTIELTKREIEILRLVREGLLSKEISNKLSLSIHTVNTYRQKLLLKLGANNSMEAIIFASKLGLLD